MAFLRAGGGEDPWKIEWQKRRQAVSDQYWRDKRRLTREQKLTARELRAELKRRKEKAEREAGLTRLAEERYQRDERKLTREYDREQQRERRKLQLERDRQKRQVTRDLKREARTPEVLPGQDRSWPPAGPPAPPGLDGDVGR